MLYKVHLLLRLYVLRKTGSKVEVEPAKVHLPEVFAVVHMEEVVDVGGPTQVVHHTLLIMPEKNI